MKGEKKSIGENAGKVRILKFERIKFLRIIPAGT